MRFSLLARASGIRLSLLGLLLFAAPHFSESQTATLDFSASVTHIPVKQGQTVTDEFSFALNGSFSGNVTLSVSGLPDSISTSWSSNPVSVSAGSGYSTLTITPNATIAPNWYTFAVTASGDGLSLTYLFTVIVEPSSGMQATLSSPAVTIEPQGSATLTVTANAINGIQIASGAPGASATVASGLPDGVSASWSSPSVTPSTISWTLTLSAGSAPVTGSYPISLSVQILDANSGLAYASSPSVSLLISLVANVVVGTTPGQAIPATFMGLSHEWYDAQSIMGDSETGVNTIYRQLLTNLTSYGSPPINLRIGGDSTDTSGQSTAATVAPFAELATAMGNSFELGVNLGADNLGLATEQVTTFMADMPAGSVNALELGNEPDLYYLNGLRQPSYTFNDYSQDFSVFSSAILPLLPSGVGLSGPAGDYYTQVSSNVSAYLADYAPALSQFTEHYYAASPEDNPATDFLLSAQAAQSIVTQPNFAAAVAAAHANGLRFREDELGSISEQGVHGISDAFGAALWSIDTMFQLANAGVDGVNWEASDGNYDNPFTFAIGSSGNLKTYTWTSLNPIYYGLLFFQAAVGGGAQLLPVTLSTSANLTAWATLPTQSTPHVAIINKDETATGNVQISMPGYHHAEVRLLTAPSYTSTTGVSFAGQTFDGSTDGTIQGNQTVETISGCQGVFWLNIPITSAALVVFTN